MIYFTADAHLGHAKILEYCNRPFSDVNEMNEALIARWNEKVGAKDTVYCLGDFTLDNKNYAEKAIRRLNGTIFFLNGSHDNWLKGVRPNLDSFLTATGGRATYIGNLVSIKPLKLPGDEHSKTIVLCHYCMRVWEASHYNSWHLFGHSHGNLIDISPFSMDVGVDCHNYYPVSLETVKEKLGNQTKVGD